MSATVSENPTVADTFAFSVFVSLVVSLAFVITLYVFFSAALVGWIVSSVLNSFVLRDKCRIRIGSMHIAWLRGMVVLRDVTFASPNISMHMVDAVLSIQWWKEWVESSSLVLLSVSGLELCLANNSARYDQLRDVLAKRKDEHTGLSAAEAALTMGLEFPPDIPFLFWLCRTLQVKVQVGSVSIGNNRLPTTLVVSFTQAEGTITLVSRAIPTSSPNSEHLTQPAGAPGPRRTAELGTATLPCDRTEANIDLHEATIKVQPTRPTAPLRTLAWPCTRNMANPPSERFGTESAEKRRRSPTRNLRWVFHVSGSALSL